MLWWRYTSSSMETQCAYFVHLNGGCRFILNIQKRRQMHIQEEDAAGYTSHAHRIHTWTRNGFTIPWIWGTQVLDTEIIISTISIHSELHLIATVFWNVLQNDPFLESNSSSWRHSDEAHKNQFILLTFPKEVTCHKHSLWLCDTPEGTFLFDDR